VAAGRDCTTVPASLILAFGSKVSHDGERPLKLDPHFADHPNDAALHGTTIR
jgi:hypothetical protein